MRVEWMNFKLVTKGDIQDDVVHGTKMVLQGLGKKISNESTTCMYLDGNPLQNPCIDFIDSSFSIFFTITYIATNNSGECLHNIALGNDEGSSLGDGEGMKWPFVSTIMKKLSLIYSGPV